MKIVITESQYNRIINEDDDADDVDYAVIEISKPLSFLSSKYRYQVVPYWKTKEKLIYVNKGVAGRKTISTRNINVLKVFKSTEKELMDKYIQDLREKNS
jgi:hypothetical protein